MSCWAERYLEVLEVDLSRFKEQEGESVHFQICPPYSLSY